MTFAPKDVTPVDFTPKDDVRGLGYRGLDPLQALRGGSGASHIDLFTLDSDRTSLFRDRKAGQRRKGGISGQVRYIFVEAARWHTDSMKKLFSSDRDDGLFFFSSCVQAFGVGAMEEEDDDIYHRDAMANYDVVLGGEEPGDGLYGWTAPQQYRQKKKGESE